MSETLSTSEMELAVQSCADLQQIAKKNGAAVPLTEEEDFAVRMIYQELDELLSEGTRAAVLPRVPFEVGGVFHPENLELLVEPTKSQLTARFEAPAPTYKKGDALLITSLEGEELTHTVVGADWISEEEVWLYSLGPGYDSAGNLQAIDCYVDANDLERLAVPGKAPNSMQVCA